MEDVREVEELAEIEEKICHRATEAQRATEAKKLEAEKQEAGKHEAERRGKTEGLEHGLRRAPRYRRLRLRNFPAYDRVMPIQKAAVRMPVRSSMRRRRFLRTATIITPMAQSRKPSSGQKVAELNPLLEALAGS